MPEDTIASIATAPGVAGIAIVRVSGPEALPLLEGVFRRYKGRKWVSHRMAYGLVMDGETPVDEALAVYMKAPNSYTREDVAEIHCHGGALPAQQALEALCKRGARLAGPGEFTRRAFINGRIDLNQAEAVMDLICARTQQAARACLRQMQGRLSAKVDALQQEVADLTAYLEAYLDYPDADIETLTAKEALMRVERLAGELDALLRDAPAGRLLREGVRVVLAGRPNTGKSSLLNLLVGEERAIVTPQAGTTRDVLREEADLLGLPVVFCDTAGLRESGEAVERIGVQRARQELAAADIRLVVLDASAPLADQDRALLAEGEAAAVIALNKGDLPPLGETEAEALRLAAGRPVVKTSAKTMQGLDALRRALYDAAVQGQSPENALLTRQRHIACVKEARDSLARAGAALSRGALDCAALDLTESYQALGRVTGRTAAADIIDRIFEKFCLGK